MLDVTKYPPSAHGVRTLNLWVRSLVGLKAGTSEIYPSVKKFGGGDRCRHYGEGRGLRKEDKLKELVTREDGPGAGFESIASSNFCYCPYYPYFCCPYLLLSHSSIAILTADELRKNGATRSPNGYYIRMRLLPCIGFM
ncbi:hypothetical protein TNCV_311101 [Trichonephila clavipes]|nr:hypothetical protein TNCV_311101 [Trichonephila clavipes]